MDSKEKGERSKGQGTIKRAVLDAKLDYMNWPKREKRVNESG